MPVTRSTASGSGIEARSSSSWRASRARLSCRAPTVPTRGTLRGERRCGGGVDPLERGVRVRVAEHLDRRVVLADLDGEGAARAGVVDGDVHAAGLAVPEEPDVDAVIASVIEFGLHARRLDHRGP